MPIGLPWSRSSDAGGCGRRSPPSPRTLCRRSSDPAGASAAAGPVETANKTAAAVNKRWNPANNITFLWICCVDRTITYCTGIGVLYDAITSAMKHGERDAGVAVERGIQLRGGSLGTLNRPVQKRNAQRAIADSDEENGDHARRAHDSCHGLSSVLNGAVRSTDAQEAAVRSTDRRRLPRPGGAERQTHPGGAERQTHVPPSSPQGATPRLSCDH